MRDRRLQELRQRLARGATSEDEEAWIGELLRSADLDFDRLELAAYLGSQAARAALTEPSARTLAPKTGVRAFVKKLKPWGHSVCLRAAIAATRLLVSPRDDARRSSRVLQLHLAEEFVLDSSGEALTALGALPRMRDSPKAKWRASKLCGDLVRGRLMRQYEWRAKEAVALVAKELRSEAPVRAAIVAELQPWALAYLDPIELRVRSRGEA